VGRDAADAGQAPTLTSVLRRLIYNARFERGKAGPNAYSGAFGTFGDAERAAPARRPRGYDHLSLAGYYRELINRPDVTDYPVLFWLRPILCQPTRIFDFGGHIGVAAYALHNHLGTVDSLRWTICDVPTIVREGEALARARDRHDLEFTTDFHDADGADVLMASGSLQYLDAGFLAERLGTLRSPPGHVFVNRTPLHPTRRFFTVQCIGPTFHAYTVDHRDRFIEEMSRAGYGVVDSWDCPRRFEIPFHPGHELDAYSGLYFRLWPTGTGPGK
jgi:putative methyltransferase (TIGR04325 family)